MGDEGGVDENESERTSESCFGLLLSKFGRVLCPYLYAMHHVAVRSPQSAVLTADLHPTGTRLFRPRQSTTDPRNIRLT